MGCEPSPWEVCPAPVRPAWPVGGRSRRTADAGGVERGERVAPGPACSCCGQTRYTVAPLGPRNPPEERPLTRLPRAPHGAWRTTAQWPNDSGQNETELRCTIAAVAPRSITSPSAFYDHLRSSSQVYDHLRSPERMLVEPGGGDAYATLPHDVNAPCRRRLTRPSRGA